MEIYYNMVKLAWHVSGKRLLCRQTT